MRTIESSPYDWEKVRTEYEAGHKSNRQLSKDYGPSESAIRKRAKKEGWSKPGQAAHRPTSGCVPARIEATSGPGQDGEIRRAAKGDPNELVARGRQIIERLMDELDATTAYLGEIEDMIYEETKGDRDSRRRNAMLRAISMPTRSQAAKNLATALRTLQDAAPGKKKEAAKAAETAGRDSHWGDDLEVAVAN